MTPLEEIFSLSGHTQSAANQHGSLWEEVLPGTNAQKGRFLKAVGFRVEGLPHPRADGRAGRGWAPLDGAEVPRQPRCAFLLLFLFTDLMGSRCFIGQ